MDRILAAEVFITAIDQGSITAAAKSLKMSRSMASRYISAMEEWAGSQLLHRSTRKISLTSAGEEVLGDCRELMNIANKLPDKFSVDSPEPRGVLRISCSQFIAQCVLPQVLQQFLTDYPHILIDIHISNDAVNMIEQRIDLAIRISNNLDPNLIARTLGYCSSVLCATEQYLAKAGTPTTPQQLLQHNCLSYSFFGNSLWQFSREEEQYSVPIRGNLSANESMTLLETTLLGLGISHQPKLAAQPFIDSGALQQVLSSYTLQPMTISGIYLSRKNQSRPLRLLLDHLVSTFSQLDF